MCTFSVTRSFVRGLQEICEEAARPRKAIFSEKAMRQKCSAGRRKLASNATAENINAQESGPPQGRENPCPHV